MFGERYFVTRDRISDVMLRISDLARETGGQTAPEESDTKLNEPFIFIACGEVNAGKSTFINGLFGHELCRINVLPETHRVLCYRHGSPARDEETSPLIVECFREAPFLRDFNVIDTPGTNSTVRGHMEIIEKLLPLADLILMVFPVSNPWGAATWNLISGLTKETLDRVVIILQQADQRDAKDIEVILGHMADLSMKRTGRVPPIFAVSGKLACEAKKSTPFAPDLMRASGYAPLETHISLQVCETPERREALESWHRQALAALMAVDDRIESLTKGINDHARFIESLESEIDDMRATSVNRLPSHLEGVAAVFEAQAVIVTKRLRRRLWAVPSIIRLFTGDHTGHDMEAVFISRLQTAVEEVAEKDGNEVVDACHAHWRELATRVRAAIGADLTSSHPIEETLSTARQRFVQRLGSAARQGIGNLKVRNQLDRELRRRNVALKSFTSVALALTTAGAVCGAQGVPWLPCILCALAGVFLTGGVVVAWLTRRSITRELQQRLLDTCGAFASTLYDDYEEALRIVYRDYASTLGDVRTYLAREKISIEPRRRRWHDLFLTLKAIEQEL